VSDTYSFSLPQTPALVRAMHQAPALFMEEIDRFLARVLPQMTAEVVDRTPASQGHLRSSIIGSKQVSEHGWLGVVSTSLGYALPVELGTRPHPVSEEGILALAEWAKRTLPLGQVMLKSGKPAKAKSIEDAALAAAHAIAWKIRARGTQGAFMFRTAFEKNREWVMAQFGQTVTRIAQRLGSGL